MTDETKQYKLNLPAEIDKWIEECAAHSLRSKSAEIIFILKEKMEQEKEKSGTTA
jgi:hypothetical protein